MLDIHSHFLPKMDDGSKSVEMSLEMLRSSKAQGVTTIVSTSHFYGSQEDYFKQVRVIIFWSAYGRYSLAYPKILMNNYS